MYLFISCMNSSKWKQSTYKEVSVENLPLAQRGTFLTLMQLHFNYFTIIAAVVKKNMADFFKNLATWIFYYS